MMFDMSRFSGVINYEGSIISLPHIFEYHSTINSLTIFNDSSSKVIAIDQYARKLMLVDESDGYQVSYSSFFNELLKIFSLKEEIKLLNNYKKLNYLFKDKFEIFGNAYLILIKDFSNSNRDIVICFGYNGDGYRGPMSILIFGAAFIKIDEKIREFFED